LVVPVPNRVGDFEDLDVIVVEIIKPIAVETIKIRFDKDTAEGNISAPSVSA